MLSAVLALSALSLEDQDNNKLTLRTTTTLIEIQLVAQDRHGNPISDLTRDDFILKDNGTIQEISVFTSEAQDSAAPSQPTAAFPPGVVSNVGRPDSPVMRAATVILLDKLNTRLKDQVEAKDNLLDFLKKADLQTKVAILELSENGHLQVLSNFTTDPAALRTSLTAAHPAMSQMQRLSEIDLSDPGDTLADPTELEGPDGAQTAIQVANHNTAEYANRVRVVRTLRAMESIGRGLSSVPGRKSLVWFSDGFPFSMGYERGSITPKLGRIAKSQIDFAPQVTRTMRSITDANIAVYPIDARGLSGVASADSSLGFAGDDQTSGTSLPESIIEARLSMDTMAHITGGKAFYGRNDLDGALRNALADSKLVYILGYHPSHEQGDGKFHPVEIKVNRKGVSIRYRSGYYALPDNSAKHGVSLLQVLADPFDATGIAIIASALSEGDARKVDYTLDAQHLTLTSEKGNWLGTLDVLFVQEDSQGKPLEAKQFQLALNWPQQTLDDNLQHGARFTHQLKPLPTATHLRIVVRDHPSDRIGSLTLPLN